MILCEAVKLITFRAQQMKLHLQGPELIVWVDRHVLVDLNAAAFIVHSDAGRVFACGHLQQGIAVAARCGNIVRPAARIVRYRAAFQPVAIAVKQSHDTDAVVDGRVTNRQLTRYRIAGLAEGELIGAREHGLR
jgi:hypothetical protein